MFSEPVPAGDVLPFLAFIATLLIFVYVIKVISDNRVRRMAIEKGAVAENMQNLFARATSVPGLSAIKWGMLLIAVGIASIIGIIHERSFVPALFFLTGAALLSYYPIEKRLRERESQQHSQ